MELYRSDLEFWVAKWLLRDRLANRRHIGIVHGDYGPSSFGSINCVYNIIPVVKV